MMSINGNSLIRSINNGNCDLCENPNKPTDMSGQNVHDDVFIIRRTCTFFMERE